MRRDIFRMHEDSRKQKRPPGKEMTYLRQILCLAVNFVSSRPEAEMKGLCTVAKEAKGAEPKGHHYVPAMYLRGFTGAKEQLYSIDRPSKKWFRTSPDNVAKKKNFNRIESPGMDPLVLEKTLSELESEVAPALEHIKETRSLAVEGDRSLLVNLMAAVALRNPRRREDLGNIITLAKLKHFAEQFGTKGNAHVKAEDFEASKEEIIIAEIDQHDPLAEALW